jgi:hypothetical protein
LLQVTIESWCAAETGDTTVGTASFPRTWRV